MMPMTPFQEDPEFEAAWSDLLKALPGYALRLDEMGEVASGRHNLIFRIALLLRMMGVPPEYARYYLLRKANREWSRRDDRDFTQEIDAALKKVYVEGFTVGGNRKDRAKPAAADHELQARVFEEQSARGTLLHEEGWRAISPKVPPTDPRLAFHELFPRGSLVWTGDSPKGVWKVGPFHRALHSPRTFVCPATFKEVPPATIGGEWGGTGRKGENVSEILYRVIEFDDTPREEQFARISYMKDQLDSHLVAVVFSGNSSIHSWWYCECEEEWGELRDLALRLGADPATFKAQQPVRMPAATGLSKLPDPRTGLPTRRPQPIYYWDPVLKPDLPFEDALSEARKMVGHRKSRRSPGATSPLLR